VTELTKQQIREIIEREFELFFVFPGDDRRMVTSVSARLFAEHCIEILLEGKHDRD
jgi:hypothetical protein